MEWHYEEIKNVIGKLEFFTPGLGVIEIEFDVNSNPRIRPLDGAPYFGGIPTKDVPELLAMIKERYPNGFHSRVDTSFKWLKARLEDLAEKYSVKITSIVPYGCLMLNKKNYDAYKLEVKHEKITSPIYIAMTSPSEEFVVFRPYIRSHEFGRDENFGIFAPESKPTFSPTEKVVYFEDEIVSYKTYSYDYNGEKLKAIQYGFKNNKFGFMYESKFGNFMAAGGTSYLS